MGDFDSVNAAHPHMDDPRFLSLTNQMNHCTLRFYQFTRCARELGEEETRCKYQYYRAQRACTESQLEDWGSTVGGCGKQNGKAMCAEKCPLIRKIQGITGVKMSGSGPLSS